MELFWILLGAFGACAFFSMLFHAPRKCVLSTALIGTVGYAVYLLFDHLLSSPAAGAFMASLVIALLSEWMARRQKAPATLFLSGGIIALVPGGGLYRTMLALMQGDYSSAAAFGVETVMIAGCIALAIAPVSALFRAKK